MTTENNNSGQPVGYLIRDWVSPLAPPHQVLDGVYCRLEPLNVERHADALHAANKLDATGKNWTYLSYGPFDDFHSYQSWVATSARSTDPLFFAIIEKISMRAVGVASFVRIDRNHGTIEVGHLNFSPLLQRRPAATEAMYLMMKLAFSLGYRRYEWRCNALNAPSRRAAQRLGLSFEGIFFQHAIFKGRNRDTAWYAAVDKDWPALSRAFEQWLAPENFDAHGRQKVALSSLTAPNLRKSG